MASNLRPRIRRGQLIRAFPALIVLVAFGVVAFLHFAQPVALPVFVACIKGMTLKPLIGLLSRAHLPKGRTRPVRMEVSTVEQE